MQKKREKRAGVMKNTATGLVAGFCNGLFGSGGGIIAVVALQKICALEEKHAHATALGIILPLSAVSSFIYILRGAAEFAPLPFVAPALMAGSFLGAKLLGRLKSVWVGRLFSVLMLAAGLRMLL